MAIRQHLERVWRDVSINHGFEEIEGPTFEHLDLYTVKSGPGIVSELFSFRRAGGETDYALRPEFTPTLARMFAARANSLPMPTKWFCIPSHFRAERPQRGRLREFLQWNVDMIGDTSPSADAEVIACAVGVLREFGLTENDVTVKISHRELIAESLAAAGVDEDNIEQAMVLLDRREKLEEKEFERQRDKVKLDVEAFEESISQVQRIVNDAIAQLELNREPAATPDASEHVNVILELINHLNARCVLEWCAFDARIVRGLAYYTGIVFEVIADGERAVAGGGRYDKLIELFGGPATPACGFAMGDVVLRLLLEDKGLLEPGEAYQPAPDLFVISNGETLAEEKLPKLVAQWRDTGLHVRHTYRATRNVGKLLGEAGKTRARFAVILGEELADGYVQLKNLASGDQEVVKIESVGELIQR